MILPTIPKSCTVNWSLFLSTSIRESRTTCYRKQKDKLLWVFSLRKVSELSNMGSGLYRLHKDMAVRHFTQTGCALRKLSERSPMFSKSTWIIIWFSEITTTGFLEQNRIHKTVIHPMETVWFAFQQTQMYITCYISLSHTLLSHEHLNFPLTQVSLPLLTMAGGPVLFCTTKLIWGLCTYRSKADIK